jgi:hypothetical protein
MEYVLLSDVCIICVRLLLWLNKMYNTVKYALMRFRYTCYNEFFVLDCRV